MTSCESMACMAWKLDSGSADAPAVGVAPPAEGVARVGVAAAEDAERASGWARVWAGPESAAAEEEGGRADAPAATAELEFTDGLGADEV